MLLGYVKISCFSCFCVFGVFFWCYVSFHGISKSKNVLKVVLGAKKCLLAWYLLVFRRNGNNFRVSALLTVLYNVSGLACIENFIDLCACMLTNWVRLSLLVIHIVTCWRNLIKLLLVLNNLYFAFRNLYAAQYLSLQILWKKLVRQYQVSVFYIFLLVFFVFSVWLLLRTKLDV